MTDRANRSAEREGHGEGTLEGALAAQRARCRQGQHVFGEPLQFPFEHAAGRLATALGYQSWTGEEQEDTDTSRYWSAMLTARCCPVCSAERLRLVLMRWNTGEPLTDRSIPSAEPQDGINYRSIVQPDEKLEIEWDL